MTHFEDSARTWVTASPPSTEMRPTQRRVHGVELCDPYAWLCAANWREVLRDPARLPEDIGKVLVAENEYTAAHLDPLADLITTLKAEMRGRMKENDSSVPIADGDWLYYRRFRDGGQQPVICRRAGEDGDEAILLDGDLEGDGHAFFSIGDTSHSPDHSKLAWSADSKGSELHEIRVRDLPCGGDRPDVIGNTDGSIVWMRDSLGFYYVEIDENHRTCRVWRHRLSRSVDDLVFEENHPAWFVGIDRTVSGTFLLISVTDHDASECHLVDLADPDARPRCVEPRARALRYSVTHREDTLFIRTNADGAEDFKIVQAPVAAPGRANWVDIVPHERGRIIVAIAIFPRHLVRLERKDSLPRIIVRTLGDGEEYAIGFSEDAYSLSLEGRLMFESETLRFAYASMTTPRETFDYDLRDRTRQLRKRQEIPSGHVPSEYVTRRILAEAPDGAEVPISLLHRKDQRLDGQSPLLLYGYGAYGHAIPAGFNANVLSLVDRGFVFAIAHVRGGADKGWHWYLDGKLDKKPNTFSDFLTAARRLVAEGYTSEGRIIAHGGSAGGMLMGAIANLAPELFAGILASVPFVDVLNTILDPELPLTPPEWLEWGNPIEDPDAFAWIRAYSPYDNVSAQAYPPILAMAGLADPRVTYWEPAKWVAKLRATATGGGPILLKTNMGAGHGGASGRFDRLTEVAEQYAFAIACAERVTPR